MKLNQFIATIVSKVSAVPLVPGSLLSRFKKSLLLHLLGQDESAFRTVLARIDWKDVRTPGRYSIATLPAGATIISCYFVIETAWKSRGLATMKIQDDINSGYMSINPLTAGAVHNGWTGSPFSDRPRTIDLITKKAAWTAGMGVLVFEYIETPE